MKRYREKHKSVTLGSVTPDSVTEEWYPNKPTDSSGKPITPVKLSDGQEWYPKNKVVVTPHIKEDNKVIHLDNGSYIHLNKLVDPKWRSLLTYLAKNMRYPDGLRVGIQGPTITEVKELLQATA